MQTQLKSIYTTEVTWATLLFQPTQLILLDNSIELNGKVLKFTKGTLLTNVMQIVCLYLSFNNHMIIKVSLMREGMRKLNVSKGQRTYVHCSCREVNRVVYISQMCSKE